MTLTQLFTAIANQIRRIKGTSGTIIAENFPTEMSSIELGKLSNAEYTEANDDLDDILENTTVPSGTLNITENGEYDVTNYVEANVNVVSEYNTSIETTFSGGYGQPQNYIKKLPPIICNRTSTLNMFHSCCNLEEIPNITFLLDLTYVSSMFAYCEKIKEAPLFNTKKVTNFGYMFQVCSELITVPCYDTSSATYIQNMFTQCPKLSNESLNNILQMCINAISYTGTKTLAYLGLTSAQVTTCQSLSNYQAFLDAGWTTGY